MNFLCSCPSTDACLHMHMSLCAVLSRLLLYMSVLNFLHKSYLSYQGTDILCLHYTVQSVIIIIKNKPKQNPTRYGVSMKIRCCFCRSRASSEVLHSSVFVPKMVLFGPYRDLCLVQSLALLLLRFFF